MAKKDVVISAGWDISTFIQQATNLTGGNVQFATLPIVRYDKVDGQDVNIVDTATVQNEVRVAFGLPPLVVVTPSPLPSGADGPPSIPAPVPSAGPQGLPMNGSGIACVD